MVEFRWNDWNLDHVPRHGVSPDEAEAVARGARPPYPERRSDEKWMVRGRGVGGRLVQVVYLLDDDGTLYIIHARPLTDTEKRRYHRRLR
jgi:uncharacterized DUF497 family protein